MHRKKERRAQGCFLVEGAKIVAELLASDLRVEKIAALPDWYDRHASLVAESRAQQFLAKPADLERASALTTPNQVLAVASTPDPSDTGGRYLDRDRPLHLAFDALRNPANLGAVVRIADWFGLTEIWLSPDSVDAFNPKAIQAAMGSTFRVRVRYADLAELVADNPGITTVGAVLSGEPLRNFTADTPDGGPLLLMMGNESTGLGDDLVEKLDKRLSIERLGRAESLNLSVATGILVHHLTRQGPNR